MPKQSGGAQQFRRGDRIRVIEKGAYRFYLRGLVGEVTQVLHHGLIVALDNDPMKQQRVLGTNSARHVDQTQGVTGPKIPNRAQRQFMFHEVEKIPRA
jgi:hypothetical protein